MPIDFRLIGQPSRLAIETPTLDAERFVSVRGSDSNDGLSRGNPKLTLAAAAASLPQGTDNQPVGEIIAGPGAFALPSTFEYGYGANDVDGFTLRGQGKGRTYFTYAGTGEAMRPANFTTPEQKWFVTMKNFTLYAPAASAALDVIGCVYGDFNIEWMGASSLGSIATGGVGIRLDGSYGPLIGNWWNTFRGRVSGFDQSALVTGVPGNGQANENSFVKLRCALYKSCGINDDCGDNTLIFNCDMTPGVNLVPSVAAIRFNGLAGKGIYNRFEQISAGGICYLLDGAGTKPGDRCLIDGNVFATLAGSIAVQINNNSREHTITLEQMFSRSPGIIQVVDNGLGGFTTWSTYGRGMQEIPFASSAIAASMTNVPLDLRGGPVGINRYPLLRPYQLRGTKGKLPVAITTGTLTLTPTIGGVAAGPSLVMTSASTSSAGQGQTMNQANSTDPGQLGVGLNVTTSADYVGPSTLMGIAVAEYTQ